MNKYLWLRAYYVTRILIAQNWLVFVKAKVNLDD